jgi:CRISPR-associated protein Csn2
MKLYYAPCGLEIGFDMGQICGVSIENVNSWRNFIESLWVQANGDAGNIFITDKDKEVKVDKDVSVIFNPFSLDVNDKKIISKLYVEMKNITEQDMYVQKMELNSDIVNLLDEINARISYPIEFNLELDIQQLFKLYNVKINMHDASLIERISNYVKLAHQILGIKIFVFVHLKQYLSDEEWGYFNEMIVYEQVAVLLLENSVLMSEALNEKWWIIDADNCIISI